MTQLFKGGSLFSDPKLEASASRKAIIGFSSVYIDFHAISLCAIDSYGIFESEYYVRHFFRKLFVTKLCRVETASTKNRDFFENVLCKISHFTKGISKTMSFARSENGPPPLTDMLL